MADTTETTRGAPPWFVPPTPEELIALKEKYAQMKDAMTQTTETKATWPRIFLSVQREVEGRPAVALREISLDEFLRGRYMGPLLVNEINAMLREVGYGPQ